MPLREWDVQFIDQFGAHNFFLRIHVPRDTKPSYTDENFADMCQTDLHCKYLTKEGRYSVKTGK